MNSSTRPGDQSEGAGPIPDASWNDPGSFQDASQGRASSPRRGALEPVGEQMPDPEALLARLAEMWEDAEHARRRAGANYALYSPRQAAAVLAETARTLEKLAVLAGSVMAHLDLMRGRMVIPGMAGSFDLPFIEGGQLTRIEVNNATEALNAAADTFASAAVEIERVPYTGYADVGSAPQIAALAAELRGRGNEVGTVTLLPNGDIEFPFEHEGRIAVLLVRTEPGYLNLESFDDRGFGHWAPVYLPPGYSSAVHPEAMAEALLHALDRHYQASKVHARGSAETAPGPRPDVATAAGVAEGWRS